MTWVATAVAVTGGLGVASSLIAGDKQRSSANSAADRTERATAQARQDLMPWTTTGSAANSKLAQLLGIAPQTGPDWSAYLKNNPDVAASVDFGNNPQAHYEQYGKKEGRQLPMLDTGAVTGSPDFGSLLKPFTGADLPNDPGYQFALTQGEKGINNAAAARGNYFGGAAGKALTQFNNDYATTKFDDAFNRDQTNKSSIYGMLSGTSGVGANAAGQQAGIGTSGANTANNYATSGASAGAAGLVGGTNALTNSLGSYMNYNNQSNLINLLRGSTSNYNPNIRPANQG